MYIIGAGLIRIIQEGIKAMAKVIDVLPHVSVGKQLVGWLQHSDLKNKVPDDVFQRMHEGAEQEDNWASYDCYENYDIFYLRIPMELKDKASLESLTAYISGNEVLIAYTHWRDTDDDFIPHIIRNTATKRDSAQRTMLAILDFLTKNDGLFLAKLEDRIITLEESVMSATPYELKGKNSKISELRREIHPMEQFYEQLMDALEDFIENENEIYSDADIKYATRIHNRAERLYKTVINLRDFISQVREAYQTQIDIGLNDVMKIFTVLTAIFLPLTLLVGWYGMNLIIPEFEWEYGYPAVIALSIAIVVGCLIFFKRKKWF